MPKRQFSAIAADKDQKWILALSDGSEAYLLNVHEDRWRKLCHRSKVSPGDPQYLRVASQSYFAVSQIYDDPIIRDRIWVGAGTGVYFADLKIDSTELVWESQIAGIEELVANDIVSRPARPLALAAWDFGIHIKDDLESFSKSFGPKERVVISAQQIASSPANADFLVTNASDARSCCSEDGNSVLAGYTLDNGKTWQKFKTLPTPPGTASDDPWRMSFGMIAAASDDEENIIWVPSYNRAAFYTLDLGKSWERIVLPNEVGLNTGAHQKIFYQRKTLVADAFRDKTFLWYYSGNDNNPHLSGLWKTTTGGKRWEKIFEGEISSNSGYSAKLRASPIKKDLLFFTNGVRFGKDVALRVSTNGGMTWKIVENVSEVDDIGFDISKLQDPDSANIFISGKVGDLYGIWLSNDLGKSWRMIGDYPLGLLDQVTVISGDANVRGRVVLGFKGSGWVYGEPSSCKGTSDEKSQGNCFDPSQISRRR